MPAEYFEAINLSNIIFPALYQFENGLRLVVNNHLEICYGANWWDLSLKGKLPNIFEYAKRQRERLDAMPWIGASSRVEVLPVHLVTLGHLEEIIKAYHSDCIPELFPTLEFFLGHMEIIKRVRNLYTHMFPCITRNDCSVARSEIRTLALHINTKLA
ncbi:MAG: hypothetical protein ACE5MH_08280 [Terriglobia bacterium]